MYRKIVVNVAFFFILCNCVVTADRLPDQVPENQLLSVSTVIDGTGIVDDTTTLDWILAGTGSNAIKSTISPNSSYIPGSIAQINTLSDLGAEVTYHESSTPGSYIIDTLTVPDYTADNALPSGWPASTLGGLVTYLGTIGYINTNTHVGNSISTGKLKPFQEIAIVNYKDHILTNGGKIAENKNFDFDSKNKAKGIYNIEAEKVLTYSSTEGAHLASEEFITLDVAGSWANATDSIRCVFANSPDLVMPAFCNVVSAKSNLININSAQISTKGQVRSVAKNADVPAELNYQIAVTPDANSGSGFAEGTVSTTFAGSIMEARDNIASSYNKTAAENTWKDVTEVTGGIKNFQKSFEYQSGFKL